jgi:hypothetical protein
MSLKVEIQKSKDVSKWVEYKDAEGNVLAEFEIRGDAYKPYRVALERAQNQISSKGYLLENIFGDEKLYHELLLEACARELIKDWKGVVMVEDGKEVEPPYTPETAEYLLNEGDIGIVIWNFIREHAAKIQSDADMVHKEILGK